MATQNNDSVSTTDTFRMAISGFPLTALLGLGDMFKDTILPLIDTKNVLYLEQISATALLIQYIQEEISFRETQPNTDGVGDWSTGSHTSTGPRILTVNGVDVDSGDYNAVRNRISQTRTEQLDTDS